MIARGLAEESGQADPAEHQGDRRRHVERPVGTDRRDVRGGSAIRCGRDHDRRQRHHQTATESAPRPDGWARRCVDCAPAEPSSSSAHVRTSASSRRFPSRCAGWRAVADCGWRAHRPRRSGQREAFRFRSPTCWPPSSTRRRNGSSPTTCSIRRRPDTCWRPSSCCLRSVMRWASSSHGRPAEQALEVATADVGTLLPRLGGVSRLWRRSTGVPAPSSLEWSPRG